MDPKHPRFKDQPLPPPEPEVGAFVKIVVPACYSKYVKLSLVDTLVGPSPYPAFHDLPEWQERMAKQLAAEIEFEILKKGPDEP